MALPININAFIGRDTEFTQLRDLLAKKRLVTLTGPGGVGKTRLALEIAHAAHADGTWRDGVVWMDLRPFGEDHQLPRRLAAALGSTHVATREPVQVLMDEVAGKDLLIVLDNCEHLLSAVRDLLQTLLTEPGVTVLATSRHGLALGGEHLNPLTPLAASAAKELFEDRLLDVRGDFPVAEHEAEITRLCRAGDNLPLAIEILAVASSNLSPSDVERRLATLLHADRPTDRQQQDTDADRSHRSFHQVMELSWELCTPQERTLWQRLSVFAGGFTLEAAEAVCGFEDLPESAVARVLGALKWQSIVTVESPRDGHSRYRLLEPIRQHGDSRAAQAGEAEEVRQRHYNWLLRTYREAAQQWLGPDEAHWLTLCRDLQDDAHSAIAWCARRGQSAAGIELLLHIVRTRVPFLSGRQPETQEHFERLLTAYTERDELRAMALAAVSVLAVCRGDKDTADKFLSEAQALTDELGAALPLPVLAEAIAISLGHRDSVDPAESMAAMEKLCTSPVFAQPEFRSDMGLLAMFRSFGAAITGEEEIADAVTAEFLADAQASQATWHITWSQWARAAYLVLHRPHDPAARIEAESLLHAALPVQRGLDDRWGPAGWTWVASGLAGATGDHRLVAERSGLLDGMTHSTGVAMHGMRGLWETVGRAQNVARQHLGETTYAEIYNPAYQRGRDCRLATAELLWPGWAQLTERERDIVRLVAQGLSNVQIAARLDRVENTVAKSLTKIYATVDVSGRDELREWYAQL
ncbi:ATP-binding protein [Saccharopolyspora sp. NPDC002376]